MPDPRAVIDALWPALTARDIDAVVALLHPDVDWQDTLNGGRRVGRDAVRAYLSEVMATVVVVSTPINVMRTGPDRYLARVNHVVRNSTGQFWGQEIVNHLVSLRDGLIVRMDNSA
ncbi:MAG: nuclear transport factor 2 family protein [Caulobacter sp.]|nr:nuclear transport factor 2 family protein [Caulobacter sp.]